MYICICKQVSEQQIVSEIHKGCKNLEAIQKKLSVSLECGSCLDCVLDVLAEHTVSDEYVIPVSRIKHLTAPSLPNASAS